MKKIPRSNEKDLMIAPLSEILDTVSLSEKNYQE